ncbi:MAG: ferrous iron transport protein A [Rubrivivax sp.]|jgi:Fe2+ transport system protein FeoA|nr:ferrous iron transport protein A [Rubrivivax sp.]
MTQSLWTLRAGDGCRIIRFDDALAASYRVRMMELGFHPGEIVSCVHAPALGAPKVYRVSNTLYSLDDEVALHIHVEPLSHHE